MLFLKIVMVLISPKRHMTSWLKVAAKILTLQKVLRYILKILLFLDLLVEAIMARRGVDRRVSLFLCHRIRLTPMLGPNFE